MSPLSLWRSATAPTVRGDHAQRAEAVLLSALATLVVVGLLAFGAKLVALATRDPRIGEWLVWSAWVLGVSGASAAAIRFARRGHHRQVATGMVVILTLFAATMAAASGIYGTTWAALSLYAVVFAATTLGHREAVPTAAAQALLIASVGIAQSGGWEPIAAPEVNSHPGSDSFGVALVLALVVQACWHYTRETETSVDEELAGSGPDSPLRQLRTRTLTVREIEVVRLVAEGLPDSEIAKQLVVSPRTVHTHVANALKKTACANRTELGVLAVREGLAPIDPEGATSPMATEIQATQATP